MKEPAPLICLFRENANRPGVYDFVKGHAPPPVRYFRISEPRKERFRKQGATLMLESWTDGGKAMFTGLVRLCPNVLYGDHRDEKGKKSLLCLIQESDTYQLHYFRCICPKSLRQRAKFLSTYFIGQLTAVGND